MCGFPSTSIFVVDVKGTDRVKYAYLIFNIKQMDFVPLLVSRFQCYAESSSIRASMIINRDTCQGYPTFSFRFLLANKLITDVIGQ